MQLLQAALRSVPPIHARITVIDTMNIEVQCNETAFLPRFNRPSIKRSTPVRRPIPCGKVEELFQMFAIHSRSARVEIKSRTPSPHNRSERGIEGWCTQGFRR